MMRVLLFILIPVYFIVTPANSQNKIHLYTDITAVENIGSRTYIVGTTGYYVYMINNNFYRVEHEFEVDFNDIQNYNNVNYIACDDGVILKHDLESDEIIKIETKVNTDFLKIFIKNNIFIKDINGIIYSFEESEEDLSLLFESPSEVAREFINLGSGKFGFFTDKNVYEYSGSEDKFNLYELPFGFDLKEEEEIKGHFIDLQSNNNFYVYNSKTSEYSIKKIRFADEIVTTKNGQPTADKIIDIYPNNYYLIVNNRNIILRDKSTGNSNDFQLIKDNFDNGEGPFRINDAEINTNGELMVVGSNQNINRINLDNNEDESLSFITTSGIHSKYFPSYWLQKDNIYISDKRGRIYLSENLGITYKMILNEEKFDLINNLYYNGSSGFVQTDKKFYFTPDNFKTFIEKSSFHGVSLNAPIQHVTENGKAIIAETDFLYFYSDFGENYLGEVHQNDVTPFKITSNTKNILIYCRYKGKLSILKLDKDNPLDTTSYKYFTNKDSKTLSDVFLYNDMFYTTSFSVHNTDTTSYIQKINIEKPEINTIDSIKGHGYLKATATLEQKFNFISSNQSLVVYDISKSNFDINEKFIPTSYISNPMTKSTFENRTFVHCRRNYFTDKSDLILIDFNSGLTGIENEVEVPRNAAPIWLSELNPIPVYSQLKAKLIIQNWADKDIKLEIYNLNGDKEISINYKYKNIREEIITVPVGNLSSGLYILTAKSGDFLISRKFIKM